MPKVKTDDATIKELLGRGTVDVIVRESLEKRLRSGKPLRIKLGIDPTGPDIHLGHAVPLHKLRQFQDAGHQVTIIIGDWTARIGDPTDRNEMRPQLTPEQVKKNAKKYLQQLFLILDKKRTKVVLQSTWFQRFTLQDIFELLSKFTVAQLLNRDDFKKRQKGGLEIGYHEPIYSLLQAYDSAMIKADLEIGATEQLFNLMKGRELQQMLGQEPQDVMTMEILVGLDGKRKMGKSLGNYIALLDTPDDMYGKTMSITDDIIVPWFTLATHVPESDIRAIARALKDRAMNPRDAKMRLAREIVTIYHSAAAAARAEENFVKTFQKKELPDEIEEVRLKQWPETLRELLVAAGLASSMSEATRLIGEGGIKVDGEVMKDPRAAITAKKDGLLLSRGKRQFRKVLAAK